MWVGRQCQAPAVLTVRKIGFPLCTRLDGQQDRSGRVRKSSPPQGIDPWTVQPVASRYTDWAIPGRLYPVLLHNGHIRFSQSFQNNTMQIKSPWRGTQRVPRSIRTIFFYQKQRKNSTWSSHLLCIRLPPSSNLNTETGYPDSGVFLLFRISRKISGYTLIRP